MLDDGRKFGSTNRPGVSKVWDGRFLQHDATQRNTNRRCAEPSRDGTDGDHNASRKLRRMRTDGAIATATPRVFRSGVASPLGASHKRRDTMPGVERKRELDLFSRVEQHAPERAVRNRKRRVFVSQFRPTVFRCFQKNTI